MNSKEKIRDIKSVINEFYHQMKCEGKLTECANECWKSYQKYCDDIEKDLKQTKLNFRNSQTHSKNCYKKLKEKYIKLEKDYDELFDYHALFTLKLEKLEKENQELKEDNLQMQGYYDYYSKENVELNKELKRCQEYIQKSVNDHKSLIIENGKMKKALEIYRTKYIHDLYLRRSKSVEEYNKMTDKFSEWDLFNYLTQEEYELLKEVLRDE